MTHSESGLTGSEYFAQKCAQCHAANLTIGPSLKNVYGRKAGSLSNFKYTDAIKQSDISWTRENLIQLMLDPQGLVEGINMIESNLDEEGAELIVNYLERL